MRRLKVDGSGSGFDSWDMPGGGRVNFRDNDEGAPVYR